MEMTNREFNQNLEKAKDESLQEPLIITDGVSPTHVLMGYAEFQTMIQAQQESTAMTLLQRFAQANPDVADIDLDIKPRSHSQRG